MLLLITGILLIVIGMTVTSISSFKPGRIRASGQSLVGKDREAMGFLPNRT